MKLLKEFRKFAVKGNAVDLAVGVVIGAAFNDIIKSFVSDIIAPPINFLLQKISLNDLYLNLSSESFESVVAAKQAGAPVIAYGLFISAIVGFLITAWVVFLGVKGINKLREQSETSAKSESPSTKKCPFCFSEINKKATRCPECTSKL